MSPRIRPTMAALPTYKAGRSAAALAGLTPYKLSSNENPFTPLPGVLEAAIAALATMHRYPDPFSSALVDALVNRLELPAEQIAVGTGSVGVCQQIVQAVADAGDEVIYAWRSFEAYPIITQIAGAIPRQIPLRPDGSHDLAAMAAAITERTRVIFVCTPNNPTGNAVSQHELDEFLAQVPTDVLVVIDEAYIEFNRDPSTVDGMSTMRSHSNVGLLRTFSKAYGIAALRVGYFAGPAQVAEVVRKTAVPFGVATVAQAAAVASLAREQELFERVEIITHRREWFERELAALGWQLPASQANFVWLPLGQRTDDFFNACQAQAVAVRPFSGEGVRISIGEEAALERVLTVLQNF